MLGPPPPPPAPPPSYPPQRTCFLNDPLWEKKISLVEVTLEYLFILKFHEEAFRTSHPEKFHQNGVLNIFAKVTGKYLSRSLF